MNLPLWQRSAGHSGSGRDRRRGDSAGKFDEIAASAGFKFRGFRQGACGCVKAML
jgi:hypothetical protein